MGVCILRRIQGLQKCTFLLLLLLLFCLLLGYYPSRFSIQQALIKGGAAASDHPAHKTPQGHTSSASTFSNECLSSTIQAMQQEKRVLIHRDNKEKGTDGGGDYMEEDLKKLRSLRKRIGSRPPMCRNKCETCFPCEAVKLVPTPTLSSSSMQNMVHLDYSNYDPEGWKCKCGARIFNP